MTTPLSLPAALAIYERKRAEAVTLENKAELARADAQAALDNWAMGQAKDAGIILASTWQSNNVPNIIRPYPRRVVVTNFYAELLDPDRFDPDTITITVEYLPEHLYESGEDSDQVATLPLRYFLELYAHVGTTEKQP